MGMIMPNDGSADVIGADINQHKGWPDLHDSRFKNKNKFAVNSG